MSLPTDEAFKRAPAACNEVSIDRNGDNFELYAYACPPNHNGVLEPVAKLAFPMTLAMPVAKILIQHHATWPITQALTELEQLRQSATELDAEHKDALKLKDDEIATLKSNLAKLEAEKDEFAAHNGAS